MTDAFFVVGTIYVAGALVMAKFLHWLNGKLNKTMDTMKVEVVALCEETAGLRNDNRELIDVMHEGIGHVEGVVNQVGEIKAIASGVMDIVPVARHLTSTETCGVGGEESGSWFDSDGDEDWGVFSVIGKQIENELANTISDTVLGGLTNFRKNLADRKKSKETKLPDPK